MKRYKNYKDSSILWIGFIPRHWNISTVGRHFKLERGRVISKTEIIENKGKYPVYSSQTSNNGELGKINTYDFEGEYVTWTTDGANTGTCFYRNGKFSTTNVCGMLSLKNIPYSLKYLNYYLNVITKPYVRVDINPKLMNNMMANIPLLLPVITEQKAIASFLDRKTSQIDHLIQLKQRKIELLKEKRTALINQVVTKGLNPDVEMKESGVEWIGKIPKHYQIGKLKHLCDENQRSLSNSTDPNYVLNYIEISDVNSEGVIENSTPYVFSKSPSRCRRIVQKGDVIVSTVRTYLKSIGLIIDEVEDLICSTGFSVLTPKAGINSKYLFYLLRTEWFISMVISESEGVSYPSIKSEKLMNIDIIFCELMEQQQIVSYLDEQIHLIDKTVSIEEQKIELLKEYKQALISEVVTGKVRVYDQDLSVSDPKKQMA